MEQKKIYLSQKPSMVRGGGGNVRQTIGCIIPSIITLLV